MIDTDALVRVADHFDTDLLVWTSSLTIVPEEAVGAWMERQSFWPAELTASVLTKDMMLVHVPYVVGEASGTARWSAVVGIEKEVFVPCSECRGKGFVYSFQEKKTCGTCEGTRQVVETEVERRSESGLVEGEVVVIECCAPDSYTGAWREPPDISSGKMLGVDVSGVERDDDPRYLSGEDLLTVPSNVRSLDGLHNCVSAALIQELERNAHGIAEKVGSVEDLQLASVDYRSRDGSLRLYPVLVGSYEFGDANRQVHIDGHTGRVWVQLPGTVRFKRIVKWTLIIAIGISATVGLAWYNGLFATP